MDPYRASGLIAWVIVRGVEGLYLFRSKAPTKPSIESSLKSKKKLAAIMRLPVAFRTKPDRSP